MLLVVVALGVGAVLVGVVGVVGVVVVVAVDGSPQHTFQQTLPSPAPQFLRSFVQLQSQPSGSCSSSVVAAGVATTSLPFQLEQPFASQPRQSPHFAFLFVH